LKEKSETKLLTPEDEKIKERIARKRFRKSPSSIKKQLESRS